MSRPKNAAVKDIDIDIDIADILGEKYRYRIDIGHSDIDPPLKGAFLFYITDQNTQGVLYLVALYKLNYLLQILKMKVTRGVGPMYIYVGGQNLGEGAADRHEILRDARSVSRT